MAKMRDRVFSIVVVVLFLVTSLTLSILVIWQNTHPQKNVSATANSATAAASNTAAKSNTPTLTGTQMDGFTPVSSVSSLKSTDLQAGTGQTVKAGDTVSVYYTGAVAATGKIFQSTSTSATDKGTPASLSLNEVIPGWQKGIPGMKVGGTRQLLIPASEAYGASPPSGSGIPANAPLVFNVTVISDSGNKG